MTLPDSVIFKTHTATGNWRVGAKSGTIGFQVLMMSTLLIGYGNIDRADDGVGFHVLSLVAEQLGREPPDPEDDGLDDLERGAEEVGIVYLLQLLPELAETVAGYDRVCFIDAHTTDIEEEIRWAEVQPSYQTSSFTHHLTPEMLLSLASLYGGHPEGLLVSIRGHDFSFRRGLSERTAHLARRAAGRIFQWL